jgi:hypothetical protein
MSRSQEFPFEFASAYRWAALPFGVTSRTSGVTVAADEVRVRFGPWRLRTPLANIVSAELVGGFAFVKTAGPPHLSFSDRGISFTTNGERAVCLQFRTPVPGIEPTGRLTHPGATLSVADPEGLARAIGQPLAG